jgi:hypothetical protein
MLLFHYVLCFARRATILLYGLVLLSTRAVNEQSEENERKRKKERERERERIKEKMKNKRKSFFYMPTPPTRLACSVFSETRKKKKRENEK